MIYVSVIIPTYNRCEYLRTTINSLQEQNFLKDEYEIIIVDNNSTDNTPEVVEKCNREGGKKAVYIKELNLGLHNARHAGAKVAKGEILAYVDDDVICDKNWLSELIKPYNNSETGCVGGKILPKWEIEPPEWIKNFPKFYLSILDDEEGPKEARWIYGCNFSVRKSLLFELGGFNPDAFGDKKFWWYRGDGEIGLLRKVHNVSKKVIYNPKAIIWHFIPKERLTIKYFKERAFKSGIETSFLHYRYNNNILRPLGLLKRVSFFGVCFILHNFLASISRQNRIKHKVLSSYYKARFLYELKLATNNNLLKFVRKKCWLE